MINQPYFFYHPYIFQLIIHLIPLDLPMPGWYLQIAVICVVRILRLILMQCTCVF